MSCRKIALFYVVLIALLCGGCGKHPSPAEDTRPFRVVAQIRVFYENGPLSCQRSYTREDKMQQVLDYLRRIDPYGTPGGDPEEARGSDFRIELIYTDGSKKEYHQRSDRFMRINDGPWKQIDPEKAEDLSRILCEMDSDP